MRYKLDSTGYVLSVFWGCYSNGCAEYTGTVPAGYRSLAEWSEKAIINAYYINEDGNLTLNVQRLAELEEEIEKDTIENQPVLSKDLYGTNNVLAEQYETVMTAGQVIEIHDAKKINPKVLITGIDYQSYTKIDVVTTGKQMLKDDAKTESISGMTFTKNLSGSITINGSAMNNVEYNISGSSDNTIPLFTLKKDVDYYINLGGELGENGIGGSSKCVMKYYDGTETTIVYEGSDGVIRLPEDRQVTQVILKITTSVLVANKTIYPMLNYGAEPYEYEKYKSKKLSIDFSSVITDTTESVDYIEVQDSEVHVGYMDSQITGDGVSKYLAKGNVNLFDGYNLIYTMQPAELEVEYNTHNLKLEGTKTRNNNFEILDDGSMVAHNGSFSGTITATEGEIGGFDLGEESFTSDIIPLKDYTEEDVTKIQQYIMGSVELTEEEQELYDLNGDGKVSSKDYTFMKNVMNSNVSTTKPGKLEINSKSPVKTFLLKDGDGKEVVNVGLLGIETPRLTIGEKEVVTPSFAQMWTNGFLDISSTIQVYFWGSTIQGGDFYCEPGSSRIVIPAGSCEVVEIYGHIAGGGYAIVDINLLNGTTTHQLRTLIQPGGNTYTTVPVGSMLIQIPDTTIDSYLIMNVSGYNGAFLMNSGFHSASSYMGVKKIK